MWLYQKSQEAIEFVPVLPHFKHEIHLELFPKRRLYKKANYRTMNTWTNAIVLVFLATIINGVPIDPNQNGTATMLDVIIKRCPQLDQTEMLDNLNKIFTKQCVNWREIDTTYSLSNRSIDQCLLLYESMNYFCTKLDQHHIYPGLVPTSRTVSTYDISTICMSGRTFESLFPNKTEHNISKILEPMNCVLTCGGLGQNEAISDDICKYAYYFASFDVKKFVDDAEKLNTNFTNPLALNEKSNTNKTDKNITLGNINKNKVTDISVTTISVNNSMQQKSQSTLESTGPNTDKQKAPAITQNVPKKLITEQNSSEVVRPNETLENDRPKIQQQTGAKTIPGAKTEAKTIPKAQQPDPNAGDPNQMPVPNINKDDAYKNNNAADLNGAKDQDDGADDDDDSFADQAEDQPDQDNAEKSERVKIGEAPETISKKVKPNTVEEESVNPYNSDDDMEGDSNFFSYFSLLMCLCVVGYVGYHNRQKILALILEGKRSKKSGRARRPNSANYHKLDSNLEEAMSSTSCTKNASNVIY